MDKMWNDIISKNKISASITNGVESYRIEFGNAPRLTVGRDSFINKFLTMSGLSLLFINDEPVDPNTFLDRLELRKDYEKAFDKLAKLKLRAEYERRK